MKNLIKYAFAFVALGSSSVFAQKSSIDSPHNYKRPVFQQQKALAGSNSVRIYSQSSHQIKNNISSVHNYKRQGVVDFTSEAALALQIPTNLTTFNPLLSSSNYKAHFTTTEFGKQMAVKEVNNNQTTLNINKKGISGSGLD
ncbi:MAG: hypothetical protein ACOVO2_05830 [Emticicia sp.]|uniref:hypothetical protein n=1 Tax=Emticicia sp. TaxID=1930953 RepID=UPI003BA607A9